MQGEPKMKKTFLYFTIVAVLVCRIESNPVKPKESDEQDSIEIFKDLLSLNDRDADEKNIQADEKSSKESNIDAEEGDKPSKIESTDDRLGETADSPDHSEVMDYEAVPLESYERKSGTLKELENTANETISTTESEINSQTTSSDKEDTKSGKINHWLVNKKFTYIFIFFQILLAFL